MSDNDMEAFIFEGNRGDKVPASVEKLVINQGIRKLPTMFCFNCKRLREVTLPNGLTKIGKFAFHLCENLLEINICNTVQSIGMAAFKGCEHLTKVEFGTSATTLPNQLETIEHQAFRFCSALSAIRLPSSVDSVGGYAFANCLALVKVDLSTTSITEISKYAFAQCHSLQTASLPKSLERICGETFYECDDLVTVVVPLNAQPINIGHRSFDNCGSLANLVLPKDSTVEEDSFCECKLLEKRYGGGSANVATGLAGRFDDYPAHRLCYDHSTTTPEELLHCIKEEGKELLLLVDEFEMTPFHVLFSTIGPSTDLLQVLLDAFPYFIIGWKDANGNRPMDYLIKDWTDAAPTLFGMSLQKWMVDPINRWGSTLWKEEIQSKVDSILFESDHERERLWTELRSKFEHYENIESTTIFELALWKAKLSSGRTRFSSKRQARDRGECRCVSGSNVVIPHVLKFLDTGRY